MHSCETGMNPVAMTIIRFGMIVTRKGKDNLKGLPLIIFVTVFLWNRTSEIKSKLDLSLNVTRYPRQRFDRN